MHASNQKESVVEGVRRVSSVVNEMQELKRHLIGKQFAWHYAFKCRRMAVHKMLFQNIIISCSSELPCMPYAVRDICINNSDWTN